MWYAGLGANVMVDLDTGSAPDAGALEAAASDAAPDALDWSAVQADFKSLQGPDPIVPPGP